LTLDKSFHRIIASKKEISTYCHFKGMTAQENVKACRDQFLEKMNCYQYSLIREAILIAISDSFKVSFHPTRIPPNKKKFFENRFDFLLFCLILLCDE